MRDTTRYSISLSSMVSAILILVCWATASFPVVGPISLKFEDNSVNIESLADNPSILLPLHAVAHYYKVDFQWSPEREQVTLSRNGMKIKLLLGSQHALVGIQRSSLLALSKPPEILDGAVALPPDDIVRVLLDLFPSMDVSWDEAEAAITVKKGSISSPRRSQSGFARSETAGKFELKKIVIDPGHGGHDPGAVRRGVQEKQIVLDIGLRLKRLIESKSSWEVVMTRDSDKYITLQRRTEIANQYLADSTLFISIHCNAHRSSAGRGLETYVFNMKASDAEAAALAKRENATAKMDLAYILSHCYHVGTELYSSEAAQRVQSLLVRRLGFRNRGVKSAPFYVLAGTRMPAMLVELGFVSNYYDRKKLQSASFRQSAAEALFDAISDFNKAASKSLVKANVK